MNVKVEFSRRKIEELSKLEGNPRKITADEMECLKESLTSIPEYMEAHPIVLSDRTGELVIIDGNQRMEAARQLGWVDVPTALMSGLTEEKEKEIIIRANVNNGEWDEELLAEWDAALLDDWGVDISAMSESFSSQVGEENYGDQFTLPSGEKEPFQQMTFTLADAQAEVIKEALADAKHLAEYDYMETFGNSNTNGNALYLIISQWAEQRK